MLMDVFWVRLEDGGCIGVRNDVVEGRCCWLGKERGLKEDESSVE